jgi:hypothetical protein
MKAPFNRPRAAINLDGRVNQPGNEWSWVISEVANAEGLVRSCYGTAVRPGEAHRQQCVDNGLVRRSNSQAVGFRLRVDRYHPEADPRLR